MWGAACGLDKSVKRVKLKSLRAPQARRKIETPRAMLLRPHRSRDIHSCLMTDRSSSQSALVPTAGAGFLGERTLGRRDAHLDAMNLRLYRSTPHHSMFFYILGILEKVPSECTQ